MSKQRTTYRSWSEQIEHRERFQKKLEKFQGLQALLTDWEQNEVDSDEYRHYLNHLKERVRSARNQFMAMKP